jgi:asparagine synthase (glutamine-hydrolysing)
VTDWPEFVGEATWREDGFAVRVDSHRRPIDVTTASGLRIVVAGEFNKPETAAEEERVRTLLEGDPMRALESVAGGVAAMVADPAAETLLLATDAFGLRPIYYWSDGERVAFATRLADLRRRVDLQPALDWEAVYHYLNFSYVPGPGTILRHVFVLPPGCVARCRKGKVDVARYWDMAYPADATGSKVELAAALRRHIERSVRMSWPMELPRGRAGCFLSGGTDSGTIAAILSQLERPLHAYSIAFGESAYDELGYAKALADRYRLAHHVHRLTADDLLESIPLLVRALDQPLGNPSAVATWRCARLARETGLEVLLAGDGGDEIFGGNERYAKDRIYALYHRLPRLGRRAILAAVREIPGDGFRLNRIRNFAYRGSLSNPERFYSDDAFASRFWDTLVTPELRRRVTRSASLDIVRDHYQRPQAHAELDRLLYTDLKMAIWGNDLVKVSVAARAAGIRVRFPFLDPSLAGFTGRLDPTLKVRGLEKRYLFKRAIGDLLPEVVLHKPKHGFGVPVAEWIRSDPRVREAVLDPILDRGSLVGNLLTRTGLDRLVDDHLRARWDHGTWLWALMMLARWHGDPGGLDGAR